MKKYFVIEENKIKKFKGISFKIKEWYDHWCNITLQCHFFAEADWEGGGGHASWRGHSQMPPPPFLGLGTAIV